MLCSVFTLAMGSHIYSTKVPALKPWKLTGALDGFGVHSTKTENVQALLPQDRKLLLALTFSWKPIICTTNIRARCCPCQGKILLPRLRSPPPELETSSDCSHPKAARTESYSWPFPPWHPPAFQGEGRQRQSPFLCSSSDNPQLK